MVKNILLSTTFLFEIEPYKVYKVVFQPLMQGGPAYVIRDPQLTAFGMDDHLHSGPMPASQDAGSAFKLLSDYLENS